MNIESGETELLLQLSHWKREIAELYAKIREVSANDAHGASDLYRKKRDQLFFAHPQSPLDAAQKSTFVHIPYFEYDPDWRLTGTIIPFAPDSNLSERTVPLAEGVLTYRPFARVRFIPPTGTEMPAELTLYWIGGYGGGLFLPFRDATSGTCSYGGGRYLYDTIKGADLGAHPHSFVLDFNFAYNPSCAYNSRWVCPLSPAENTLSFEVNAGEKSPDFP